MTDKEIEKLAIDFDNKQGMYESPYSAFIKGFKEALKQGQTLPLDSVSGCPFEAYAVFCIECDRQGIKPIKYKDYLEIG